MATAVTKPVAGDEARQAAPLVLSARQLGWALVAAVMFSYAVTLVVPYGVADDYPRLAAHGRELRQLDRITVAAGRPLAAALTHAAFSLTDELGDLRYIRLLGVLGIALCGWLLARSLQRAGWSLIWSVLGAFWIVESPPFQVLAARAVSFSAPWAAAAAVAAFQVAEGALRREASRRRWLELGAALALMVLAGVTYPPAVMFYLVAFAIWLFRRGGLPARDHRLAGLLAVGLSVALLAAGTSYGIGVATAGRFVAQRSPPLGAQLSHFIYPLVDALNLWQIWSSPVVAIVVVLFLAGGLWLALSGPPARRAAMLGLAVVSVPVAFLPNLFTVDGWGTYRSQVALTALLMVYTFIAVDGWFGASRHRLRPAVQTATLVVLTIGAGIVASRNVMRYFATPQMMELRVMKSQIARVDLAKLKRIWVAGVARDHGLSTPRYDEYGTPSTSVAAAEGPMVWVLSREILHGKPPKFAIAVAPHPFRTKPGDYLVNMSQLDIYK